MAGIPSVTVWRRGEDRAASGHPWVYSSDVVARGQAVAGDTVRVVNHKGRAPGVAHYSSTSPIRTCQPGL